MEENVKKYVIVKRRVSPTLRIGVVVPVIRAKDVKDRLRGLKKSNKYKTKQLLDAFEDFENVLF